MSLLSPALIIQKKRDGKALTKAEIQYVVDGLLTGSFAHYQATALLMAIYFQGMNHDETVALTLAMLRSGKHYTLKSVKKYKVDKHSTGGVGDKVSLILAPLAVACGNKTSSFQGMAPQIAVPMMSGRGLGHTGGTLDKLESIPGFNVKLTEAQFESVLNKVGCAMIGQSKEIAPADRILYALRDVTGTIECIPLIVASILSKKLAEGANALVLDVKYGSGAFMPTLKLSQELADTLVQVANELGLRTEALVTSMEQPLGYSMGNIIEVYECIEILGGPQYFSKWLDAKKIPALASNQDLIDLTVTTCAHMLNMAQKSKTRKNKTKGIALTELKAEASNCLNSGAAYAVFEHLCKTQKANLEKLKNPARHIARYHTTLCVEKTGYVAHFDTRSIGNALVDLGGGRKKAEDKIDPSVGMVLHAKLEQKIKRGSPWITVFHAKKTLSLEVANALRAAITLQSKKLSKNSIGPLIQDSKIQKVGQ